MKMELEIEERVPGGSGAAKRMRRNGQIPGNVYGLDAPPFQVAVEPRRLEKVLRSRSGQNTVLTLSMATRDVRRDVLDAGFRCIQVSAEQVANGRLKSVRVLVGRLV